MGGWGQAVGGVGQGLGSLAQAWWANRTASEERDWQEDMFNRMQELYPAVSAMSRLGANIYGSGAAQEDIENFLMHPIKMTWLEERPKKWAEDEGPAAVAEAAGKLRGLWDPAESLLGTRGDRGEPVSIRPIVDHALNVFRREMTPEVANRFGSSITGSGFRDAMGRAMGDVSSELGQLEYLANEAGMDRFMNMMTLAPSLFQAPVNLETAFAQLQGDIGEQWRLRKEGTRPGVRLLGAMPTFANIASSQGFFQPGFPQYGSDFSNWGSALGQGLSAGADALSSWWQNRQTPGTSGPSTAYGSILDGGGFGVSGYGGSAFDRIFGTGGGGYGGGSSYPMGSTDLPATVYNIG